MKRRWLLSSLVLVLICLLLSCSSSQKGPLQEYYREDCYSYFDELSFEECVELTQFQDWSVHSYSEDSTFIWFQKEDKHAVYNAVLDKTVLELEGEEHSDSIRFDAFPSGTRVFWHLDAVDSVLTLYQADGQMVFSKPFDDLTDQPPKIILDLLFYNGSYYRENADGSISYAFDKSPLAFIPEKITYRVAKNYYVHSPEPASVAVYDAGLNQLSAYRVPSYAKDPVIFPLNDGNLLIQYKIALPSDTQEYELLMGEEKYDLVSLHFDVEKGISKELALDYYLAWGRARSNSTYQKMLAHFADDVVNVIKAYDIKDKRIDENEVKLYAISNSGQIEKCLNDLIPNQGENLPVPISSDYYTLKNADGQLFLLNALGEVQMELPSDAIVKRDYIYYQNALYDHEGTLLYKYPEKMRVESVYEGCILLYGTESKNTYLFSNGESRALITARGGPVLWLYDYYEGYFYTENPGTRNNVNYFRVYNEDGDRIAYVVAHGTMFTRDIEEGILIVGGRDSSYYADGIMHFYRLS